MMADIKQAAKWMQEGKDVTGGNAIHPIRAYAGEMICFVVAGISSGEYEMDLIDLLAEDWELAPTPEVQP